MRIFLDRGIELPLIKLYDETGQTVHSRPGMPSAVTDRLMKTKQVAELIGLSDSTVKRLVNSGVLRAVRTQGGHRLIPESEARAFLVNQRRESGVLAGLPEAAGDSTRLCILEESLLRALLAGDEKLGHDLIVRAIASGYVGARLADDLIRPVMWEIGRRWERSDLDIYEEHYATRIVESALLDVIRRLPSPLAQAPLAIGAAPEGDPYTLSGLLAELALRQLGWRVINLGENLPLTSLSNALLHHRPRLAWLSVHWLEDRQAFIHSYQSFFDAVSRTGTALVLGGPALDADLRSQLVAASFGDRMSHLCEFARRLTPESGQDAIGSTDRLGSNPT